MADALSTDGEKKLAEFVATFYDDPYGFVMAMYPWGEPTLPDGSSNPLKSKKGPEPWQRDLLVKMGQHIRENAELKSMGLDYNVWRSARASGHGVGKSALVAWLIQFFMATRPDTRAVVTANTQKQLEDKTWPELSKWHQLLLCRHWFQWTATSYYFAQYPDDKRKNYMVTAMTVSADNTEAFAGLHNEGGTVFVIFDEASGIEQKVWEVADGALTDGEGFFLAFGNPTRPDGAFYDCFDKYGHMYDTAHIDSREVSHTNKQALRDILEKYGDDSDEAKVRVKGQFPVQSYNGFISPDTVTEAINRELFADTGAALIMAVDVARFGGDEIVVGFRQGRDARSRPFVSWKGTSITKTAEMVSKLIDQHRPDATVVESTGPGAGVIDILRDRGYKIIEVHPGAMSSAPEHYLRKRDELWGKMRDWLVDEGCIYDDPILFQQLTRINYSLQRDTAAYKIEAKEDYKQRTGLSSPDRADTLGLTFAVRLARRDANLRGAVNRARHTAVTEYDPLTY